MNIQAPQIIMMAMIGVTLGIDLASHGKPREGKINFGITLISKTILVGLLYWGGFFG